MKVSWPTQEQDLQAAADIIGRHARFDGMGSLGVFKFPSPSRSGHFNSIHNSAEALFHLAGQLEISDWCAEIFEYFINHYGYEHGFAISVMVLTKLLLKKEVIH